MPDHGRMIDKKLADSQAIAKEAFERYGADNLAIAYTGGKDSTLLLYIVREACRQEDVALPPCFVIDEGDMFPEIRSFIAQMEREWGISIKYLHNADVSSAAGGTLGAEVRVTDLSERNRAEIERLGYDEEFFDYEPESFVGNHLMKTVPLNAYLYDTGIAGFFEGIRWDEQGARSEETYFSPRAETPYNPAHVRICPLLHFREREVWEATLAYGLPFCRLYKEGYRSLGARVTTTKTADVPAWEQDLENTNERGGRRQDKEGLMKRLRDLGYM